MEKCTFQVRYQCADGQAILVTGDLDVLGEWQLRRALLMEETEKGQFEAAIELPSGTDFEYKYVLANAKSLGKVQWEVGENRKMHLDKVAVLVDEPFQKGMEEHKEGEVPDTFINKLVKLPEGTNTEPETEPTKPSTPSLPEAPSLPNTPSLPVTPEKPSKATNPTPTIPRVEKPWWLFWQSDEDFAREYYAKLEEKNMKNNH